MSLEGFERSCERAVYWKIKGIFFVTILLLKEVIKPLVRSDIKVFRGKHTVASNIRSEATDFVEDRLDAKVDLLWTDLTEPNDEVLE